MAFFKVFTQTKRTYLDYASATPHDPKQHRHTPHIDERVINANPGALHAEGVGARRVLEQSRARVAHVLDVHDDEIIFTGGATESDNLALVGALSAWKASGILSHEIVVYTSDIEHAAVRETLIHEHTSGVSVKVLSTTDGVVNPKDIVVGPSIRAVLVSVMYINNEIGTVQPVVAIAKQIRKLRKEYPDVQFVFHTDATQAPAHFSLRVPSLGVDMMTLGATKLYCTRGVGVLYKKRSVQLNPVIYGGRQEFGLRSGTQAVELIHEFSYALQYTQDIRETETARVIVLQEHFESAVKKNIPNARITRGESARSPHISHLAVPTIDSELLVIELDARGVAVSAKSACQNDSDSESYIVDQLYGKGWGTVRFSFGRMTTKKDVDRGLAALQNVLQKYQKEK